MFKFKHYPIIGLAAIALAMASCKVPAINQTVENRAVPASYGNSLDTANSSGTQWRAFFTDKNLISLIDTALKNNQEMEGTLQEIEIARSEIRLRQGQLMPTLAARFGADVEKVGRYTSQGAGDASTEIAPGKATPDPLTNYLSGFYANWEIDIWKKLHNSKKAAITRYLASVEGKNFLFTNLISEVANSYYELLAFDNQLELVKQNIALQNNALELVKVQKEASRVTELAVQKFRAEVLNSQSLEFDLQQSIRETENRINLLLGRYPQEIPRDKSSFLTVAPISVHAGIPLQLLANRPDIKQAELELAAAKLDVKVARAEFYPSLGISAALGLQAFKPSYIVKLPESVLYSVAGDLVAPLVNRNAIKAEFASANARQLQAMYKYERTILNAYLEVSNQLSKADNLEKKYSLKSRQVDVLTSSIDISNDLFKSARADYFEVLMTQRDALESKLELIETKKDQLTTVTNIYRNLGGGWK
ncbi:TolC family protein [Pedobacter metabolipauper]|uniref:NodT family efflux transporter outer membrane factor (OMF) lipoprotein n=1 Tax=Pedobacter metabolipauper TaxID=425513 RepID=A0A4R6SZE4_9SPHI|nr:TolC family protein [Pedobacter metabolipauper]TDQ10122.1 NodT family efflux transporter outer membrane factor (OMF) lipoprotein [Pedobacter metabolipauper]